MAKKPEHEYRVRLVYGSTFYVPADDYSYSQERVLFWVGNKIVRSFPSTDVEGVDMVA